MSSDRTLFFAYDAGSANVTMAYAYKLHKQGKKVEAFAKGPAIEIYKKNIPDLLHHKIVFTPKDTVIVGTSGIHSDYEMGILKQAKLFGVKQTIVILDSIDKIQTRFILDSQPLESSLFPHEIWTPKIPLLINTYKSKVTQINDPYLEYIHTHLFQKAPAINNPLIKQFKGKYLVILSEYVEELFGDRFGFNEWDSINYILDAMDSKIPVLLKTHPAEPIDKYDALIKKSSQNLHSYRGDIHELIYYAKVVTGINSSVFQESLFLKKPSFSVQIGSCERMDDIMPEENIIYDTHILSNVLEYHFKEKS